MVLLTQIFYLMTLLTNCCFFNPKVHVHVISIPLFLPEGPSIFATSSTSVLLPSVPFFAFKRSRVERRQTAHPFAYKMGTVEENGCRCQQLLASLIAQLPLNCHTAWVVVFSPNRIIDGWEIPRWCELGLNLKVWIAAWWVVHLLLMIWHLACARISICKALIER